MSEDFDFERYWLAKFERCLGETVGEGIRDEVMEGSEELTAASSRSEVIAWSRRAMEKIDGLLDEDLQKTVMTGCACQYPKSNLQAIRQTYQETKNIAHVHKMLQEQFEDFLETTLQLDSNLIEEIVQNDWGAAGVLQEDTILATKIPKSSNLLEYMSENDPQVKRELYCHCPRVREAIKTNQPLSPTYCYCGAGFYKGIWEEIIQKDVEVEILESVLQGGDVCKIAIYLPDGV